MKNILFLFMAIIAIACAKDEAPTNENTVSVETRAGDGCSCANVTFTTTSCPEPQEGCCKKSIKITNLNSCAVKVYSGLSLKYTVPGNTSAVYTFISCSPGAPKK
ncbi:MAG: hypothetical protein IPO92_24370 [Saprospiraceae bacterium]|nr:hypothetical protein [Saprospiraceae bacterium]